MAALLPFLHQGVSSYGPISIVSALIIAVQRLAYGDPTKLRGST